ncbi:MAG: aminomethyl-transferring glycine dehydrogenase subunit GcvPB [Myxococcales bacterium]|nr:aminomethyl-transferring glycine dehydrogenase subunit GcvPB [Myxococcota bacterium]MDW8280748.1 aminomethyl-transferring glycine dehydrogenase subunit GcvPB [Myxococcales bacterium]
MTDAGSPEDEPTTEIRVPRLGQRRQPVQTRHLLHAQPPIFEQGAPGRSGASLPPLDVPEADPHALFGDLCRVEPPGLPEVSEVEVTRHYTRLSRWNYAIDLGLYPLGSCTMKYNPKINERVARLPGFCGLHPAQPEATLAGALELMHRLEQALCEIAGFARVTLQPAAGAQGELCGLMMIRAYLQDQGRRPTRVLVPDSAHGTNPASCTLNQFQTVPLKTSADGLLHVDTVRAACRAWPDDIAAIMITNPSTLGLFEEEIADIADVVHEAGGLVYMDGANFNALLGKVRPGDTGVDCMHINLHKTFTTPHGGGGPGSGPVGVSSRLEPYLPIPTVERRDGRLVLDYDRPRSIGRLRSFFGNFGMFVRAYAYIREMGGEGLRRATEMAVLNAAYLRARLEGVYPVAYDRPCMHEVILSDKQLRRETGVQTLDIAKRLMDYGFHPPTVYFPLVVPGALMIEPTETETVETLDEFADALLSIAQEAREDPERVRSAPHQTALRRLDETRAARQPRLRWLPEGRAEGEPPDKAS